MNCPVCLCSPCAKKCPGWNPDIWKCRDDLDSKLEDVHEMTGSSDRQLADLQPGMWILHKWQDGKEIRAWEGLIVDKDKSRESTASPRLTVHYFVHTQENDIFVEAPFPIPADSGRLRTVGFTATSPPPKHEHVVREFFNAPDSQSVPDSEFDSDSGTDSKVLPPKKDTTKKKSPKPKVAAPSKPQKQRVSGSVRKRRQSDGSVTKSVRELKKQNQIFHSWIDKEEQVCTSKAQVVAKILGGWGARVKHEDGKEVDLPCEDPDMRTVKVVHILSQNREEKKEKNSEDNEISGPAEPVTNTATENTAPASSDAPAASSVPDYDKVTKADYPKKWNSKVPQDFFFYGPNKTAWCLMEDCGSKMQLNIDSMRRHVQKFHIKEKKNNGAGLQTDAPSAEDSLSQSQPLPHTPPVQNEIGAAPVHADSAAPQTPFEGALGFDNYEELLAFVFAENNLPFSLLRSGSAFRKILPREYLEGKNIFPDTISKKIIILAGKTKKEGV